MDRNAVLIISSERQVPGSLKPSMFNRIVRTEEGLTLYNSAHGTKGILRIQKPKVREVTDILSRPTVSKCCNGAGGC